jgi:uncharacterized protein YbjT (DUF2867 family)
MKKQILVIGGSGMLGRFVARQLAETGFQVRIMVRDLQKARGQFGQEFELFTGDVADVESLQAALDSCYGAHISVGGAVDQVSAENVAALAPELGLAHVTYVSGSTVRDENSWFPMTAQKLAAETAVSQCGVPYTIFCPTWPMEQLPRFVINGRATLVGDLQTPWHWFAGEDFGRMVANAYQSETAVGKRLYIHGPEPITMKAALERYCQAFYPEIKEVMVMPVEFARATAESTGNMALGFFAELMAYFDKVGEPGDPAEANRLLGAPTTTLDAWIAQQQKMHPVGAAK